MKQINKILVVILLVCMQSLCFAQVENIDNLRQINICKDYHSIQQASFPFNDSVFKNLEYVRLDTNSLKAIYKASVVSFGESEEDCVSGENDDEATFQGDFNAEVAPQAYTIIRLRLPASYKNIGAFIISTYEYMNPSYLVTYRYPGKPGKCIEIISSVRLGFGMGNRHWGHHRTAVLHSESNIEIKGECWHEAYREADEGGQVEEDEAESQEGENGAEDQESHEEQIPIEEMTTVDVIVSILKDGTIQVKDKRE